MSKVWKRGDKLTIADLNRFEGKSTNNSQVGGGGKFVVTMIDNDGTWTADKTIAEIVTAYEEKKICVAVLENYSNGINLELQEISITIMPDLKYAVFATTLNMGVEGTKNVVITGIESNNVDEWGINTYPVAMYGVPVYSSDDNGKILGIVDGAPAWVTP